MGAGVGCLIESCFCLGYEISGKGKRDRKLKKKNLEKYMDFINKYENKKLTKQMMIQFLDDYKESSILNNDEIEDYQQSSILSLCDNRKFEVFHIRKNNGIELIKRICEKFDCESNIIMRGNNLHDVNINFQSGIMFNIGLNSLKNIKIKDSMGMKKTIEYKDDDQTFNEIKKFIKRYNKLSK